MYRIHYQSKEPHHSDDGPPVGENARGVQVIVQSDKNLGWTTQSGDDYFVFRDGAWLGTDIIGLFDYLMDTGLVLFGRMIDRGEYNRIISEAMEDKALAEKTGYLPRRFKEHMP